MIPVRLKFEQHVASSDNYCLPAVHPQLLPLGDLTTLLLSVLIMIFEMALLVRAAPHVVDRHRDYSKISQVTNW
jgi:hypothetical protein